MRISLGCNDSIKPLRCMQPLILSFEIAYRYRFEQYRRNIARVVAIPLVSAKSIECSHVTPLPSVDDELSGMDAAARAAVTLFTFAWKT